MRFSHWKHLASRLALTKTKLIEGKRDKGGRADCISSCTIWIRRFFGPLSTKWSCWFFSNFPHKNGVTRWWAPTGLCGAECILAVQCAWRAQLSHKYGNGNGVSKNKSQSFCIFLYLIIKTLEYHLNISKLCHYPIFKPKNCNYYYFLKE